MEKSELLEAEKEVAKAFVDAIKATSVLFTGEVIGISILAETGPSDVKGMWLFLAIALHLMAVLVAYAYLLDMTSKGTTERIRVGLLGGTHLTRTWTMILSEVSASLSMAIITITFMQSL